MSSSTSGDVLSLAVYREPARKLLCETIRNNGHNPDELIPVIERALDQAISDSVSPKRNNHPKFLGAPQLVISEIYKLAWIYVKSVLSQDNKISDLKNRINAYGSLFVVGAGISFEIGIPLVSQLDTILQFIQREDFLQVRIDKSKCNEFKTIFKQLCDKKIVAASHRSLAQSLGSKIIDIISLNWDDLIERAGESSGINVRVRNQDKENSHDGGYLWKFHGDIRNITDENKKGEGGWVFPDEDGFVFKSFTDYLNNTNGLKNSLFLIVTAGYSESDRAIRKVITSLEDNGRRSTYRLSLNIRHLKKNKYLVGPADYILPKILA
jgi:hypothetical protein